jgi:hypothetical protein
LHVRMCTGVVFDARELACLGSLERLVLTVTAF